MFPEIDFDSVLAEKQRNALGYGVAAGIFFALATWGYDAFLLATSHAIYPLTTLILGLLLCSLLGAAAGWLTYRVNNFAAALALWVLAGIGYAWLAGHLPLEIVPKLLSLVNPTLGSMLHYPAASSLVGRAWIIQVVVISLSGIAGLLEITFVDSTASSPALIGRYFPMIFWAALFILAGFAPESNLTATMRKPVQNVDALIGYAADHPEIPLSTATDPNHRLPALLDIQPDLQQPRQLILSSIDEDLYSATVIVRFQSGWAVCNVSNGDPVYCKPATAESLSRPPG